MFIQSGEKCQSFYNTKVFICNKSIKLGINPA